MHESDAVHPRNRPAELAPYPAHKRFRDPGVARRIVDQVQQLAATDVLEDETVMRRCTEGMEIGHDGWMGDMLQQEERRSAKACVVWTPRAAVRQNRRRDAMACYRHIAVKIWGANRPRVRKNHPKNLYLTHKAHARP